MKEKNGNESLTARQWDRASKNNSRGNHLYPASEEEYCEDEEYSYYVLGICEHNNPDADLISMK